jgi:hypothetical protein
MQRDRWPSGDPGQRISCGTPRHRHRGRNADQIDNRGGSRRAVDVYGDIDGTRRVCDATGGNPGARRGCTPAARPVFFQYGGLGLSEHKSHPLSRHHDSNCRLVDALDAPRRKGADPHGDPFHRDWRQSYGLQCERVQSRAARTIGLGPRQRIWLQLCLSRLFQCRSVSGVEFDLTQPALRLKLYCQWLGPDRERHLWHPA